jgi:peptide deformylase
MELLFAPHKMLKTVCRADFVITPDQLIDMFELMRKHNGIGLAAPQVGLPYRLFITGWGEIFINPKIIEMSSQQIDCTEGCLSIPGEQYKVWRHIWIKMGDGRHYAGEKAQVIQHELQHLDGVLISSIGHRI